MSDTLSAPSIESALLAIRPGESSPEEFADLLMRVKFQKQHVAELDKRLKDMLIEHIEVTGEPVVIGDIKYVVGYPPKYSSRDNAVTLDSLLEHEGGDCAGVAEKYLSSEPYKHGAIRKAIGDDKFDELFETTRGAKLEEKKLIEVNTKFLKGGSGTTPPNSTQTESTHTEPQRT